MYGAAAWYPLTQTEIHCMLRLEVAGEGRKWFGKACGGRVITPDRNFHPV